MSIAKQITDLRYKVWTRSGRDPEKTHALRLTSALVKQFTDELCLNCVIPETGTILGFPFVVDNQMPEGTIVMVPKELL